MDYPRQLKKKLATEMAKVDVENNISNFADAYEYHISSDSFELLYNWIEYFGVFDGGEDRIQLLNPFPKQTK
jgi:hypothetical protein